MAESGPAAPEWAQRPRETRSISALTMRSTKPGRLSSSQDFSIGRSISLTRSSSVRALLLSTVLASELKADSTAETVEWDNIGRVGALSNDAASRTGCLFLDSLNSMSSSGSILLNDAAGGGGGGGSGSAISSVSSKTSASGSGCAAGLMSASGVAASRLASIASMSSWLLLAAGGSGAGGGGAGAGFGAAAIGFGG